jgi:hypothetical protein
MLKKLASICAALILAAAVFSVSAQAQRRGSGGGAHFSGGGAHFSGGGAHFSGGGAHFGGARIGGTRFGGARLAPRSYAYRGAVGATRYGSYRNRHSGYRYGYRHDGHRYRYYGGYWPYWGWGWGVVASAWPYYYDDDYYYNGYVDDSAIAYCVRRFKSYDLASRTYLGYDGYRHSCP